MEQNFLKLCFTFEKTKFEFWAGLRAPKRSFRCLWRVQRGELSLSDHCLPLLLQKRRICLEAMCSSGIQSCTAVYTNSAKIHHPLSACTTNFGTNNHTGAHSFH